MSSATVYYGALVNPRALDSFDALPRALLAVDNDGEVAWLEEDVAPSALKETLAAHGVADKTQLVELRMGEFLMPGFIDTHTHAPQVPNIGSGLQYELLDWLEHVTFPVEAKFADPALAQRAYEVVVPRFINSGTTTCCYYGSLHLEATKILANIVYAKGQRAFIGKCNMNWHCPDYYIESSAEQSLADTHELITHVKELAGSGRYDAQRSLVHPILTPRFAISTTPDLLSSLGALAAKDRALRIQTHISENPQEVTFTRELYPDAPSYAGVYDGAGLLRRGTVLAHAVHLGADELALIAERGAGVAHCPTSNFNLRSGLAPVGEMLDCGIPVGLGTDVSGGFSPSILTAVQHASMCAKTRALQAPVLQALQAPAPAPAGSFARKQLPVAALLHLATLGGARVCALEDRVGSLAPGKAFDALLVSVRAGCGNPAVWGPDLDEELGVGRTQTLKDMLERFLFGGDDRNIRKVFVQGRCIGGADAGK